MNVLFDLRENLGWGDRSWFIPHAAWYAKQGHKVFIVVGPWGVFDNPDYDPLIPSKTRALRPEKPHATSVYNPSREPLDFFFNLICPSLDCEFWDLSTGYITKGFNELKGSHDVRHKTFGFEFDKVVNLHYLAYQWQKNVTKFDFKINTELVNRNYKLIESELSKTKNIILLSAWDENYIYEPRKGRSHGCMLLDPSSDQKFYNLVNFWNYKQNVIGKIDKFCLDNPNYRIIIANKKAQDWTRKGFLKSNYFDMRIFEKMGVSFSQALHLMTNNSSGLVSYINTMQNLMCNAINLNTILWYPTYHYKDAVCDENPDGILTAVVMNIPRYLSNPKDITEEQIINFFNRQQI